jgi:hypothetical protein
VDLGAQVRILAPQPIDFVEFLRSTCEEQNAVRHILFPELDTFVPVKCSSIASTTSSCFGAAAMSVSHASRPWPIRPRHVVRALDRLDVADVMVRDIPIHSPGHDTLNHGYHVVRKLALMLLERLIAAAAEIHQRNLHTIKWLHPVAPRARLQARQRKFPAAAEPSVAVLRPPPGNPCDRGVLFAQLRTKCRRPAPRLEVQETHPGIPDAMAVVSFAARMAWARIEALEETLYGQRAMRRDDR